MAYDNIPFLRFTIMKYPFFHFFCHSHKRELHFGSIPLHCENREGVRERESKETGGRGGGGGAET